MAYSGAILLDVIEVASMVAIFASGILIRPYEGDGRGARHPGRKRRLSFYTGIFLTAFCICKLTQPGDNWQPIWAIFAFISLGKTLWSVDGRRLHRHMRNRHPSRVRA
jgi:hypothetical protein